jgi:hypothetical protein
MKVMRGNEYFVLLLTSTVQTEEYNVIVKSEELIGTTEYLTQQKRCHINHKLGLTAFSSESGKVS